MMMMMVIIIIIIINAEQIRKSYMSKTALPANERSMNLP
jgi:hypothetical protein